VDRPNKQDREEGARASRIPPGSVFYRRVLPLCLAIMALLTLALIAVAAGVLLGVVPWR
jgi:hypothetical protein